MLSNFTVLAISNELFLDSLKIMGIGMGGIFIALFIIYLASIGLQKLFPEKKQPK